MKNIIFISAILFSFVVKSQVGIFTTNPKATLDIRAKNNNAPSSKEGVLVPRLKNFPLTNPGALSHSMLIYLDNITAPMGKGFYFWDASTELWIPIGTSVWGAKKNAAGKPLIVALNTIVGNHDFTILNDGKTGIGLDNPGGEMHVLSNTIKSGANLNPELIVENNVNGDSEIILKPGGIGNSYTLLAKNGTASNGLDIYEASTKKISLLADANFNVDNLKTASNSGIVYPAKLYAETDGTLQVQTPYSRLDDLKVNLKNFSTQQMCRSIVPFLETQSPAFYTHNVTPTQDILLELTYHVGADITAFDGTVPDSGDTRHNSKIYGVVVKLNGVEYTTMTRRMITNDGVNGYFHMADHLYIPLPANGSTYTVTLHGLVQNDSETDAGIRGDFGGNPNDRIQIIEHK